MRWLLTFLFMLLTVPALAQNDTTMAPWNTYTWPHTAPDGYCKLHSCSTFQQTEIPAFTIDGGISLTGASEIASRRAELINSIWGPGAGGHLPTTVPEMRLNTRVWSGCEAGNNSAATQQGYWNDLAAPNDANGPPPFQHFAGTDGACVNMQFINPVARRQNQLIWIYKSDKPNHRMILIMCGHNMLGAGQAGVANVTRTQISIGLRQGFDVAVICMPSGGDAWPHMSLLMGVNISSDLTAEAPQDGSNVGLRPFFEGELEIINYYSQHGIIDFNLQGNSGGGWNGCHYPALDPRVKVTWANNGCWLAQCYARTTWLSPGWDQWGFTRQQSVANRCSDAEQWWPWYFSMQTSFDNYIMASAGNAGQRKFTVSIRVGDPDVKPFDWVNSDRNANPTAWNNNPRCNPTGPCTWATRREAITNAIKGSGMIPPDNFGGAEDDPVGGVEIPGTNATQHSQSSWSRMRYMADFQELGSKAQMSHGHMP
jgi:hypothetical protein